MGSRITDRGRLYLRLIDARKELTEAIALSADQLDVGYLRAAIAAIDIVGVTTVGSMYQEHLDEINQEGR